MTYNWRGHPLVHREYAIMRSGRKTSAAYKRIEERLRREDTAVELKKNKKEHKGAHKIVMGYLTKFVARVKNLKPGYAFKIGVMDTILIFQKKGDGANVAVWAQIPETLLLESEDFRTPSELFKVLADLKMNMTVADPIKTMVRGRFGIMVSICISSRKFQLEEWRRPSCS